MSGVALHPAGEDPELLEILLPWPAGGILAGHPGGPRPQGEEDGDSQGRGRLPEGPEGPVVPGLLVAEVGVGRAELDGVQAELSDRPLQLSDDGVGLREDAPLVHRRHGAQAVGEALHAGGLEAAVPPQDRIDVEQGHVDAGVVHLAGQAEVGVVQLAHVRGIEVLGVLLPLVVPHHPAPGGVDAEVDVGGGVGVPPARGIERRRRSRGPVADADRRLMVAGVGQLQPPHVVLAAGVAGGAGSRLEAVDVGIDDHRVSLVWRWGAEGKEKDPA